MHVVPRLSGNNIEKISEYITELRDDVFKIYNEHYDPINQTFDSGIVEKVAEKYSWINKNNLSSLDSQGKYYAWHG